MKLFLQKKNHPGREIPMYSKDKHTDYISITVGTFNSCMHGKWQFHWALNKSRLGEVSTYLLSADSPAVLSLLILDALFPTAILEVAFFQN